MVVIDVLNNPEGRELLQTKYGLRRVPVLAKGDQYVIGQMIEPFAKFAGIDLTAHKQLTPEQLFEKYRVIFATAQRFCRQFSPEQLEEKVIPNRPRIIRTLCFHVFRIGEAFLEAWEGAEYAQGIADGEPMSSLQTGDTIARYGAGVWDRYDAWWRDLEDRQLTRVLKTYYGDTNAHRVFERCTWHSAQHCRQLASVLQRMGIEPDRPLTTEDLAGLPVPERLWE